MLKRLSAVCLCVAACVLTAGTVHAEIVYVADEQGNVGRYNTVSLVGAPLGSLTASGFTPIQVVGLAYDPGTDSVLIFDREAPAVYSMNSVTGVASLLFNPGIPLQGGAVRNGLIYGIDESEQTVEAFTFAGVNQNLAAPVLSDHAHALGVNPATGQLYTTLDNNVVEVNPDGSGGALVVSSALGFSEDLDPFQGDFLAADFTNITRIDGDTGATSVFLNPAQLLALGLEAGVTGVTVAVGGSAAGAPEPGTLALAALGLAGVGLIARRRS